MRGVHNQDFDELKFTEGTSVLSADGTKLGAIERVVIDPVEKDVSHLVLSKGIFFPEERVVPVDQVVVGNDEAVTLADAMQLEDLPIFEQTYYLDVDDQTVRVDYPSAATNPLLWGYPASGAMTPPPKYSRMMASPRVVPVLERNVPEGSVAVQAGASVTTADDETVGKVRSATVTDDGRLVSIEVDPGWFKQAQVIPAHFVASISDDGVRLGVRAQTLDAWRGR